MYEKILIGLDGSEGSTRAIPHAVELAKRSGGKLVVAHVEERIAAKGDMPPVNPHEGATLEKIDEQIAAMKAEGVDVDYVKTVVILGGPGSAIAEIAETEGADLIVVGTRGNSSIRGLLLGSVTLRLMHVAHRPVLAIPPSAAEDR
jgi:nucleotide-binding universal stress UspA family protein